MKSLLAEFCYGNIDPQDRGFEDEARAQHTLQTTSGNEDWLTEHLTGEEKKRRLDFALLDQTGLDLAGQEDLLYAGGGTAVFDQVRIKRSMLLEAIHVDEVGDILLGRGEGWFVTRQGDSFRILLYNYRHFSHLYALGERFDMTFTERYTPFSPEQLLDVHLSLRDVENGEYMVTETILNRSSGSAFDTWVSMGAVEISEERELANLSARSVPAINKYLVKAEDGTLRLDSMLDMLELRLIVVVPAGR